MNDTSFSSSLNKALCQLGDAIQSDARYIDYHAAITENDNDKSLQNDIAAYQEMQIKIDKERARGGDDAVDPLWMGRVDQLYDKIRYNPHMMRYEESKRQYDAMMVEIYQYLANITDGTISKKATDCCNDCNACPHQ